MTSGERALSFVRSIWTSSAGKDEPDVAAAAAGSLIESRPAWRMLQGVKF
jgi:hypothetical protein